MNYDEKCQLLIIGDSSVWKTSILTRFTTNYISTVGVDLLLNISSFEKKSMPIVFIKFIENNFEKKMIN